MGKIKRIGILTGGGDCPGLNAVIRAVVRGAKRLYGMEVVGIEDGFLGLIENRTRLLTDRDVAGILARGGTILGSSNRDDPFDQRPPGSEESLDRSGDCLAMIQKNGIEALIVVGGDGTLTIAEKFRSKGLPVVGVPKTIDNDLAGTDVTFGFDSALHVATDAVDRLHTTAESHHRVMVLEVMGRYAGWIALKAGLAGGGDAILIPEIPFKYDSLIAFLEARREEGKRYSIIVVAEGARTEGGELSVARRVVGSPEAVRLGGVGMAVAREIEAALGVETRATILGHLQRGGSPSPFDRILGTRFGVGALQLIHEGKFGHMIALDAPRIVSLPIVEALRVPKRVDPQGDDCVTARAMGVCLGE